MPEEFTTGTFRPVMPDRPNATPDNTAVDRVLLASGKVVYELEAEREKRGDTRTAILRLEQLYPLADAEIVEALRQYPQAELVMVQDEPMNQGAWPYLGLNLPAALAEHGYTKPLRVIARPASASPATGSSKKHAAEQQALLDAAFGR